MKYHRPEIWIYDKSDDQDRKFIQLSIALLSLYQIAFVVVMTEFVAELVKYIRANKINIHGS